MTDHCITCAGISTRFSSNQRCVVHLQGLKLQTKILVWRVQDVLYVIKGIQQ